MMAAWSQDDYFLLTVEMSGNQKRVFDSSPCFFDVFRPNFAGLRGFVKAQASSPEGRATIWLANARVEASP